MFFCSLCVDSISGQVSYLDNYLTEYRTLRNSLFQLIGRSDGPRSYNWNSKKQVYDINCFSLTFTIKKNLSNIHSF